MAHNISQCTPQFSRGLSRLHPELLRYAQKLCNNRVLAEDLVQDTMLRAMERSHTFAEGTNLRAWTFTILRNIYFAYWHKEKRWAPWDPQLQDRVAVSGGQEDAVALMEVVDCLQQMPLAQRNAVTLVCVGGCSYDEAAAISDCAVGTMKSRVSRARQALGGLRAVTPASPSSGFELLLGLCEQLKPVGGYRSDQSDTEAVAV